MSRPQIQTKRILDKGYFKKQQKRKFYKKLYGKPDSNLRIEAKRQMEEVRKAFSKAKAQIPVTEEGVEEDIIELDGVSVSRIRLWRMDTLTPPKSGNLTAYWECGTLHQRMRPSRGL